MLSGVIPSLGTSPAQCAVGNDAYTTLLLNFDDNPFMDKALAATSRRNTTPQVLVEVSTSVKKTGTGSAYFPNNGTINIANSNDFNFGNGSFTIDWWEYRLSATNGSAVLRRQWDTACQAFLVGHASSGRNMLYMASNPSSWDIASAVDMGSIDLNTWSHFAIVRNGNTFYTFKNGVQTATWTSTLTLYPGQQPGMQLGYWGAYYHGYIDQMRFSKGVARWTTNFAPPQLPYGPIPDYSAYNTVLLLHGEGTVGSQLTADSSPHAKGNLNFSASAQLTATRRFGGTAIYTDYNSSYVYYGTNEDFNFGYGDFTIDWWEYRHDIADIRPTMTRDSAQFACNPLLLGYLSAGTMYAYASNDNASWNIISALNMGTVATGVWIHHALVRKGNTFYAFKDGVLTATQASTQAFPWNGGSIIWSYWNASGTAYMGYFNMDEFRISKGVARWTANFEPPWLPYGAADPTSPVLLLHMDGANNSTVITDASLVSRGNAAVSGTAKLSTTQSKFGGASALFDGAASCYITYPDSRDWFFPADFTIDFWMYPTVIPPTGTATYVVTQYVNDNNLWGIVVDDARQCYYVQVNAGVGTYINAGPGAVVANQWQHFAVVRSAGIATAYINGSVTVGSSSLPVMPDITANLQISGIFGSSNLFKGYIDEFRITKGYARWTSSFTPPAAPGTP